MKRNKLFGPLYILFLAITTSAFGQEPFGMEDIFSLQYANNIQISPSGEWIVYRKMGYDVMKDATMGSLWIMKSDGSEDQKLSVRDENEYAPVWSPSGDRVAFISAGKNGSEVYIYWLKSNKVARISQLPSNPSALTWSPDGTQLAFSMFVPDPPQ